MNLSSILLYILAAAISLIGMAATFLLGAMLMSASVKTQLAGEKKPDWRKLRNILLGYGWALALGLFCLGGATAAALTDEHLAGWGLLACGTSWSGIVWSKFLRHKTKDIIETIKPNATAENGIIPNPEGDA